MSNTIYNMPQHLDGGATNPEWLAVRKGKFTGSDFHQYLGILNKGLSDTAKGNLYKKVWERYQDDVAEGYKSPAMIRGIELEPEAREEYIAQTFNDVQEVGFISKNEWEGCSPDGVIYDNDGKIVKIIEIKCPEPVMFIKNLDGYIAPEYMTQMQYNMYISGAAECDFVSYMPNMDLVIIPVPFDAEYCGKIEKTLAALITQAHQIEGKIESHMKR